jgi:hypothetical protein
MFYIAANIIFDLATGETKNVLMLVNRAEDATIFSAEDAQSYINFVKHRAKGIVWSPEQVSSATDLPPILGKALGRSEQPARFIIKGLQYV